MNLRHNTLHKLIQSYLFINPLFEAHIQCVLIPLLFLPPLHIVHMPPLPIPVTEEHTANPNTITTQMTMKKMPLIKGARALKLILDYYNIHDTFSEYMDDYCHRRLSQFTILCDEYVADNKTPICHFEHSPKHKSRTYNYY